MNVVVPAFFVSALLSLALLKSHYLRSRVVGFESAGVVLVDAKTGFPFGFVGPNKKSQRREISFPAGKVEFRDFVGLTPMGIARYA